MSTRKASVQISRPTRQVAKDEPIAATAYLQRVKGLGWLASERVQPAPRNWKTHDARQREALRGLLEEVGVAGAVLAWVPDAGARARLRAIRAGDTAKFTAWLEKYSGPVRLFDGHMRREEIRQKLPVLVTDLDEDEARRALATFDPVATLAGRNQELLAELLDGWRPKRQAALEFVDELLGHGGGRPGGDDAEAGGKRGPAEDTKAKIGADVDAAEAPFPDAPSPTVDEVLAGGRRWCVVQADALEVLRALPTASIDALITDPPYSSGGQFRGDRAQSTTNKYVNTDTKKKRAEFTGDNRDQRSFVAWCTLWLLEVARVLKPGAPVCLFTDWRQLPATTDALQAGGFVWRGIVPWDKTEGCRPAKGRFAAQCEHIVWGSNGPMPHERDVGCLWGCFRVPVLKSDKFHQTGKPTELMRKVNAICAPGGIILDLFFGSGSTGAAALLDGYRVIGVEKTDAYAPVARGRLHYVAGKIAEAA